MSGVGADDDFIARPNAEGHEGEKDGIGAGGDAQIVRDAGEGGAFLLEGGDIRPHDELAAFQNTLESGFQLRSERVVLGIDVKKRNGHGGKL